MDVVLDCGWTHAAQADTGDPAASVGEHGEQPRAVADLHSPMGRLIPFPSPESSKARRVQRPRLRRYQLR